MQFAGLQSQVEYGSFDEGRRAAGIDMRPMLPRSYLKTLRGDRRIFDQWALHGGLTDINAKVEYIRLARSLKTYGVTFFLVEEKAKGKNKLEPRLFGVTRNSCMRLDEKTKEVLIKYLIDVRSFV